MMTMRSRTTIGEDDFRRLCRVKRCLITTDDDAYDDVGRLVSSVFTNRVDRAVDCNQSILLRRFMRSVDALNGSSRRRRRRTSVQTRQWRGESPLIESRASSLSRAFWSTGRIWNLLSFPRLLVGETQRRR